MSINIWALPKSNALKQLLLALHERLGEGSFALLQQKDGPLAVTLCQPGCPDIRAYVYIYGQEQRHFGLHLEFPDVNELPLQPAIHEGLSQSQVLQALEIHLAPVGGAAD